MVAWSLRNVNRDNEVTFCSSRNLDQSSAVGKYIVHLIRYTLHKETWLLVVVE
jgi:hypothetical protein